MGLAVGVVPPIEYLDRPDEEVIDFIWHLDFNLDESDWHVASDTHTVVEYTRESMARQLAEYVKSKRPTEHAVGAIREWVDGLPWNGNEITLHFSW